jgi:hypothetical protein
MSSFPSFAGQLSPHDVRPALSRCSSSDANIKALPSFWTAFSTNCRRIQGGKRGNCRNKTEQHNLSKQN